MIFTIITYKLFDKYLIEKKSKSINGIAINSNFSVKLEFMPEFANRYLSKVNNNLSNLNYPFGLSLKKYISIKYILSIIFFIISIINKNNIMVSLIILIFTYFIPNILIEMFKKNERISVIKNLRSIVNAMIISLSASIPIEQAIKSAVDVIDYKRLKEEFEIFSTNYRTYGYNMRKAINLFKEKFRYYEIDLFASTLLNSENDGNMLRSLEKYNMVLDISYSKYLAKENSKRLLYLTFGTVLSLLNIVIIVMYPMFVEMTENLKIIFN